ncbi:ABC transporter permease [Candidatus Woesearchaeota archaeon]|nr:ABC transporter permease [Candidatus Woesearchaeota archaeon]
MKFLKTINKNLKLLMRAKSSAFIVIFGPLIIILLVGLALSNTNTYELSAAYFSPDANNSLTESFVEEIRNNGYVVTEFDSNQSCIEEIKEGGAHTCIVFPANFEMSNEDANKVQFFVDYSRANLVYQIIEAVSSQFEMRTAELSKDLTDVLLTKITQTKGELDENVLAIINIKSSIESISSNIGAAQDEADAVDFTMGVIPMNIIGAGVTNLYNLADDLRDEGIDAVAEGRNFADDVGNVSGTSDFLEDLDDIQANINSSYNASGDKLDELEDLINNASTKINNLQDQLEVGEAKNQEVIAKLNSVKTSLDNLKISTNNLKAKIETSHSNLENIGVSSAEGIVSPIKTEIKPIVSESNQLIFMFPHLLGLLIMFIGIMLSSALIIMEKSSRASFRNFTTPTKEGFFVVTTYITSFLILLAQIIVILVLSYYFLNVGISANIWLTALILLITMSIFVLIGMIVGYASATQEAATMLSIAIGSILLLLSNLILPIETMSKFVVDISRYNPYVMSSELIKQTMLFQAGILDIWVELLLLAGVMIVLIALAFGVNKASKMRLLQKSPHLHKGYIYVPEDAYLKLGKHIIKNKNDVLKVLKSMSDEEFETHVKKKNEISDWVSNILKERKLAWRLRFKVRNRMLAIMERDIEKENKYKKKIMNNAKRDS